MRDRLQALLYRETETGERRIRPALVVGFVLLSLVVRGASRL